MGQKKTALALNLAAMLMMLGVGMTMALLPQRIIDLTGSGADVGYLASAFALSYIVLQLPIGSLADKFGFRRFLLAGYLICSATGLLYAFSNSAHLIFLGRIFQGAGEAPIWALAPALLSINFPADKGKVMGVYNAVIHIGLTIGPLLGLVLLRICPGNQAFLFYAGVCLTGALIIYWGVENPEKIPIHQPERMNAGKIAALLAHRQVLAALLGIALYGAGYGLFLTIIPAFLIDKIGFSQISISIYFSLFYLAISLSQLITGPLSDRLGREIFMIAGLAIAAAGIGGFSMLDQPWISLVLAIASLGLGIFYLSSLAFLNEIVPDSLKGTISGAYYLFWGIGFFAGPLSIGKLGLVFSFETGFVVFAVALLLEAAMMAAVLIIKKDDVERC